MELPPAISQVLSLAPAVSAEAGETHSALVLSQESFAGEVRFEGAISTVEQLRTDAPNPWETGWLVWNYADNDHFYYLALKTNGWELGKRDPAYEGGQRFLATGETVKAEVGAWNQFDIQQTGNVITVSVDGHELVRFQDAERPYLSGRLGLYAEDAHVVLDNVHGSVTDDFETASTAPLSDGARLDHQWDVAFLGYGSGGVVAAAEPAPPAAEPAAPAFSLAALDWSGWNLGWLFN